MLNAKRMRKRTERKHRRQIKKQFKFIEEQMKIASNFGKYFVDLEILKIYDENTQMLEKLGYEIERYIIKSNYTTDTGIRIKWD